MQKFQFVAGKVWGRHAPTRTRWQCRCIAEVSSRRGTAFSRYVTESTTGNRVNIENAYAAGLSSSNRKSLRCAARSSRTPEAIFLFLRVYRPPIRMASTAFWACRRFSVSSKISSAWRSKVSTAISSPLRARGVCARPAWPAIAFSALCPFLRRSGSCPFFPHSARL